jgi:hypothetical protein
MFWDCDSGLVSAQVQSIARALLPYNGDADANTMVTKYLIGIVGYKCRLLIGIMGVYSFGGTEPIWQRRGDSNVDHRGTRIAAAGGRFERSVVHAPGCFRVHRRRL